MLQCIVPWIVKKISQLLIRIYILSEPLYITLTDEYFHAICFSCQGVVWWCKGAEQTSSAGGILLIWIIVGQGPIVLAVGADGGCLDIFLSSITPLFFLPLSGRRPDID